jgi:cytochrome P450
MSTTQSSTNIEQLPYLDQESEAYLTAPYDVLNEARRRHWAARNSLGIAILGYEATQEIYDDDRFRTPGVKTLEIQGVTRGLAYDWWGGELLGLDGPSHTRMRRLVRTPFSARNINRYRGQMQDQVRRLAEALPADQAFDFVELYADPLPIGVTCSLLGVAAPDVEQLGAWTRDITYITLPGLKDNLAVIEKALAELFAYVDQLIDERSDQPRDDLLSALLEPAPDGDQLTLWELKCLIAIMLVGGVDTTRFQLASMMMLFLDRPDQWEHLAAHPEMAETVAEEVLRCHPGVLENVRYATEDVEFRGLTIPAGTYITICSGAANRDEVCAGAQAEEFVFDRPKCPHLSFGKGRHHCLGSALARTELEETLRTLPSLITSIRWEGRPSHRLPRGVTGPESIPMSFTWR